MIGTFPRVCRFDIGEDETQLNFTQEQPHFHETLGPSPLEEDGPKSSMPHQRTFPNLIVGVLL